MQTSIQSRFNSISSVVTELQNALACAGRLLDLIYEETEVPDADNAEVLQNVDGAVKLSQRKLLL